MLTIFFFLSGLLALITLFACTPAIESAAAKVPRAATPAFVDSTLDTLEQQRVRQRIADVLGTPEMQRAMQEMSKSFTQGIAQGISSEEMTSRLEPGARQLTLAMMAAIGEGIQKEIAPQVAALGRSAVDGMMQQALTGRNLKLAQDAVGAIAVTATEKAMQSAAREIPETVAPALRRALNDELAPAIEQIFRERIGPGFASAAETTEFRNGLVGTGRAIAHGVVLGTNEGLAEMETSRAPQGMLARVAGLFQGSVIAVVLLLVAIVVGAILLTRALTRRAEARRLTLDSELHAAEVTALAKALKSAEGKPWAGELFDLLRHEMHARERAPAE